MIKRGSGGAICLLLLCAYCVLPAENQELQVKGGSVSLFEKSEKVDGKDFRSPHQLSYWPIVAGTDRVYIDGVLKSRDVDYTIDYKLGQLSMKVEVAPGSVIRIDYHIIPISVQKSYQLRPFTPQEERKEEQPKPAKVATTEEFPSALNFSGTKTLSLSMESVRGLTINQPTRLSVTGKVSENVNVIAFLSDEDLPLQPEGTTEEIEDLDRVLIKVEGKNLSATLGDYDAAFGETEFVLLPKMLSGAQAQGEFDAGGFTLLGAVSKGQSSSVTFQGQEGQNEYRISLDGKYIVMIAGSETVWLNGERMHRGEEKDYIIRDYGDPIVEFTNKHLITNRDVIVVDFEYIEEDSNYKRNLYGARGKVNLRTEELGPRALGTIESSLGFSYATESDDKDNPIILLSEEELTNLRRNDLDPDGDGVPLPAPSKTTCIGLDGRLRLGDNTHLTGEVAFSERDLNTFSFYDKPERGMAWKLNGSSVADNFRASFDLRQLDPNFVPIGATFSSRNRSVYQKSYENVSFGDVPSTISAASQGEASVTFDLWYEPVKHVELSGNLGRESTEFTGTDTSSISKRIVDHWSRSMKITLPNLPKINTKYQEAITRVDGKDNTKKSREQWNLEHKLPGNLNVKFTSERIESSDLNGPSLSASNVSKTSDSKRQEQSIKIEVPTFEKVSLSGEYSFETEYAKEGDNISIRDPSLLSSARTAKATLSARPKPWLDFSGYFARRKFVREKPDAGYDETTPSSITTNITDLKLDLKQIRINYQIDRKLSTEKEEHYVNYIIAIVDGREEKRFLRPGEGNYVKIDEYTYREDMEKGEYIRLVETINDRPVTSLTFQGVFSLRPMSRLQQKASAGMMDRLREATSMLELGARVNEDRVNASGKFYLLSDLQTEDTIYGLKRYWYRAQVLPVKRVSLIADREIGRTLDKRVNNRTRELRSDTSNVKFEVPLTTSLSLGGEWKKDITFEAVSNTVNIGEPKSGKDSYLISDISEQERSRSLFLRYRPMMMLSRIELRGTYKTERDDDALDDEPSVLTKTIGFGTEIMGNFKGEGSTTIKYEVARGSSSGNLPFARYDFYEGISHKIRLETSYRLKWFTDLIVRLIYRAEIAEHRKPSHRLEMEATASF